MNRNSNLSIVKFGTEDIGLEYQDWLKSQPLVFPVASEATAGASTATAESAATMTTGTN
jgi:hypothetical protein